MQRDYIRPVEGVPGKAGAVWLSQEVGTYPSLHGHQEFDVVVIGAGLVGALTAWRLVESGAKIALVDRRRIGGGVTGHSTAKLTVQHGANWSDLLSEHGEEALRPYAEANLAAIKEVADIVRAQEIACDFLTMPSYLYAPDDEGADALERESEAYAALDLPAAVQSAPEELFGVHRRILEMRNQAVFDPAAFVVGVVANLAGRITVAEDTPVRKVEEDDDEVMLRCDEAVLHAKTVVMATHMPVLDSAGYFARIFPYRSYALSFRTDTRLEAASWIPAGPDPALTLRPLTDGSDGRWIASGVHHRAGQGGDERGCYDLLAKSVVRMFPDATFEYHWSTQDGVTSDGLPFVGRVPFSNRVLMATGFAGWGMTKGVVASRVIADLIATDTSDLAELLIPDRAEPLKNVRRFLVENLNTGARIVRGLIDGAEENEYDGSLEIEVETLESGRSAVRHLPDGSQEVHSAHCTHMGCALEVNEGEITWDCPCHGSRFAADATVIEGPARDDLEVEAEVEDET